MARKPNYRFERSERDRQKAVKKAKRLSEKHAKAPERKGEDESPSPETVKD